MTNRREFLQTGVSVSSLPLVLNILSPSVARAAPQPDPVLALHRAVFDDRYAEGRRFAEFMGRLEVPTRALHNGDPTNFWYDELDLTWRRQPVAIAGVTQFGPMFVLERLGRERGMRVVFRIEHQPDDNGSIAHRMTGPPETLRLADYLQRHRVEWPALAAVLLARCQADCRAPASRTLNLPGSKPELIRQPAPLEVHGEAESVIHYYTTASIREGRGVPWDGPLYSWVIAPVADA